MKLYLSSTGLKLTKDGSVDILLFHNVTSRSRISNSDLEWPIDCRTHLFSSYPAFWPYSSNDCIRRHRDHWPRTRDCLTWIGWLIVQMFFFVFPSGVSCRVILGIECRNDGTKRVSVLYGSWIFTANQHQVCGICNVLQVVTGRIVPPICAFPLFHHRFEVHEIVPIVYSWLLLYP